MDTNQIISQEADAEEASAVVTDKVVADEVVSEEAAADNNSDTVTFEDLGLDEYALKAVERKGFVTPSPIQILGSAPRLPALHPGEAFFRSL